MFFLLLRTAGEREAQTEAVNARSPVGSRKLAAGKRCAGIVTELGLTWWKTAM